MKTITMLNFRRNAATALREVQRGCKLILSYRGKPVAELGPVAAKKSQFAPDDPLFELLDKAERDPLLNSGRSLTNRKLHPCSRAGVTAIFVVPFLTRCFLPWEFEPSGWTRNDFSGPGNIFSSIPTTTIPSPTVQTSSS